MIVRFTKFGGENIRGIGGHDECMLKRVAQTKLVSREGNYFEELRAQGS